MMSRLFRLPLLRRSESPRRLASNSLRRHGLEALEPRVLLSTITVTGVGDDIATDGVVTLREAITAANTDAVAGDAPAGSGADTIAFNILGGGVQTIALTSALPDITATLLIDGYTQPGAAMNSDAGGFNGTLLIQLSGGGAGAGVNGLTLSGHVGSTIRGLVINGFLDNNNVTGHGISLSGGSGHTITGNFLGTDPTGTLDLGNGGRGVALANSDSNFIGGISPADRNVISGNSSNGILLNSDSDQNLVRGNFLGTNAAGTVALANGNTNIFILNASSENIIGGTVSGAGNVIAGNSTGIVIGNTTTFGNVVQGNLIGTDVTGTLDLEGFMGISLNSAPGTVIGGTEAGARNVISGHTLYGIEVTNLGTTGTIILGNIIGADLTGTVAMPNLAGISVRSGPSGSPADTTIGGENSGEANLIAFNTGEGVEVIGGFSVNPQTTTFPVGTRIQGNSIHSNGGLGINLTNAGGPSNDGVTANDADDADSGANNLQNFPVIASAEAYGSVTTVRFTLNSTPSTGFLVEFFMNFAVDASGNGEGRTLIASTEVTTDANGDVIGAFDGPHVTPGRFITTTATNTTTNDTSEFSAAATVVDGLLVTNTNDAGVGSLRRAIENANLEAGLNAITFDPTVFATMQTITLSTGQLTISNAVTITGPAAGVTVDGNDASRVFDVNDGDDANQAAVTLDRLTLTGGSESSGGAILNRENLTVQNSTISGNMASAQGGGVFHYSGSLTLQNSTISGNTASEGGGVYNNDTLTVENSTVIGNTASSQGGGVFINGGSVTFANSTISGNMAGNNNGGGVYIGSGTVTIQNSTISGNSAALDGGGVSNDGTLTFANSTISGNTAGVNGGGVFNHETLTVTDSTLSGNSAPYGGGVFNDDTLTVANSTISGNSSTATGGGINNSGTLTIVNSTISGNTANAFAGGINTYTGTVVIRNSTITANRANADGAFDQSGGGIYNFSPTTLISTIVAGNFRGTGSEADDIRGQSLDASSSFNLVGDTTTAGGLSNSVDGNIVGADPMLGALIDNGGPTLTHALMLGSPALDAGSNPENLEFDQRGDPFVRVFGASADIGAYEDQNEPPTDIGLSNGTVAENQLAGTTVGTLSTTDADAGNTFTYTLVSGAGSTDNGSFQIVGDALKTSAVFNFEAKSSYSVRVRSTDQDGLSIEEAFTITVTNVNETPTDIGLSNSTVAENAGANAVVGTFSTTDPDAGDTFTYTLVSGAGSTDNGLFNISGSSLRASASLDFEATPSLSVRVRSTDQGGLFFEEAFTITVTDVNESPRITDLRFLTRGSKMTGFVVDYDQDMDEASAETLVNYGVFRGVTPKALKSAEYEGVNDTVTVLFNKKQKLNKFYRFFVDGTGGVTGASGDALDGESNLVFPTGNGVAGGDFDAIFGVGKTLTFRDSDLDKVTLKLRKGGLMRMLLENGATGDAIYLDLFDIVAGQSTLSGKLKRGPAPAQGNSTIHNLSGDTGLLVNLPATIVID